MSLKKELESHDDAVRAYDEEDYEQALRIFQAIPVTSKYHFNIGLIYATLGEHERAVGDIPHQHRDVDSFNAATELDPYLAVAYFQCGVSNFLLGRFEYALKDFEEAHQYLRGNQTINYEQLGLKFKLFSAEVIFNLGLCKIYLGQQVEGMSDLQRASLEKAIPEHSVIDDAVRDKGADYTVFSIPVGILYRPSAVKLKNAQTKDYLGKAKLISATDKNDTFTTFTGATRLNRGQLPSGAPLSTPAPPSGLTRSNTTVSAPGDLANAAKSRNDLSPGRSPTAVTRSSVPWSRPVAVRGDTTPTPVSLGDQAATRGLFIRPRSDGPRPPTNGDSETFTPPPLRNVPPPMTRAVTALVIPGARQQAPDVRGRPSPQSETESEQSPVKPVAKGSTQLADIYDEYFEEEDQVPLSPSRIAGWVNKTAAVLSPTRTRSGSSKKSPTTGFGGSVGSLRRTIKRKGSAFLKGSRRSAYDDEEEGYVSGDYEDSEYAQTKLRVKIHYQDDIRGMILTSDIGLVQFKDKVSSKFSRPSSSMVFKFLDEDGHKVSLLDESDFEMAIETVRNSSRGKAEGKLEVWCSDR
ncbi:uncharacterized protein EI90DRAFT_3145613 [Cantharellus anzutake]|uniref:uncharacterized protein n=1 Tax=Cantharellus anzutake TaxID=1750568 RepID=UPI0019036FB0|nr:uncharacterized protein EI90DRAFT_3145613 [Cantharellus anzutake]KAF8331368.1 hypothetical protein EI90DRAFT_3145613 [Cantharellus anzutake]